MLTQARVKELFHYDPIVGVFIRKVPASWSKIGDISTGLDGKGYRRVSIDGKRYSEHRLAWFYMNGDWPPEEIDHINGSPTDNSFENLRLANRKENLRNTKVSKNNKCGLKGVSWHSCSKRWRARFFHKGKEVNLGLYDTPEAAHAAYAAASVREFGEFARVFN